jgi:hypothetical protein
MKADLCAELGLLTTDAVIWTRQEATRQQARLALFRTKLNADFRELMAVRERANGLRVGTQNTYPLTKK